VGREAKLLIQHALPSYHSYYYARFVPFALLVLSSHRGVLRKRTLFVSFLAYHQISYEESSVGEKNFLVEEDQTAVVLIAAAPSTNSRRRGSMQEGSNSKNHIMKTGKKGFLLPGGGAGGGGSDSSAS
jgi:hypothetical protein